jgi:hypothetical protein
MLIKYRKVLALFAVLCFTFGITYIDFNNLSFEQNIRPYVMLILGCIALIFWLKARKS